MPRLRHAQDLLHWLDMGGGGRWIRLAATLLGLLVLSLVVSWKQFHGPAAEGTLVQADAGRQLAAGEGFTTLVNYPQTAALLAQRGVRFDPRQPYPELHHAPLYAVVIAGALRVLPAGGREALFASAPAAPDGFGGDYFLLAVNVGLLWAAAGLIFDLGRRLFDRRTAGVAALAMLLSAGVWRQTLAVDGAPLLMLLGVAVFWIWARVEQAAEAGAVPWRWLALLGAASALLFLAQYAAGALVIVILGYAARRFAGRARWGAAAMVALGFAVLAGPWVARNLVLTGSPTALAVQAVALKSGDAAAEPAVWRNLRSAELPAVDLNKLANKALTSLQESVQSRLWAGGALWLTAFFVAGWLYAFRAPATNRLRWLFTLSLGVLLVTQAVFGSGEEGPWVAGWTAPLVILFGAGFFFVLLGSNPRWGAWPRMAAAGLLVLQALPLMRDLLEPRRLHFQYPPYSPALCAGLRRELAARDPEGRFGVMADTPAGVAWYGRQRVWSQPARLRDFYAIALEQPVAALLLTPRTLARPFFGELASRPAGAAPNDRLGEWDRIYVGLVKGNLPAEFPLSGVQKFADDLYLLLNPALPPRREN